MQNFPSAKSNMIFGILPFRLLYMCFRTQSTRNRDKLTQWCVKLSRNETGKSFCQLQQRIGTAPADTDGETVKHRKRGKTGGKDYEHVDQIESW